MHARTEDLLKIRDGEPVDAALREHVLGCAECNRALEGLRRARQALRELPSFDPPAGVWARVLAESQSEARRKGPARAGPARAALDAAWRAAATAAASRWTAAAAASVAAVGIGIAVLLEGGRTPAPAPGGSLERSAAVAEESLPGAAEPVAEQGFALSAEESAAWVEDTVDAEPSILVPRLAFQPDARTAAVVRSPDEVAEPPRAQPPLPPAHAALVAESARLERALADLPRQRRVMSADTAATIAELEDRIAWLDEHLTWAAAGGLAPQQQEALWSERVEVMNALVQVRYAQAW